MNFLDLLGEDYAADFGNLLQMFKDATETMNTDNFEGEKITHTFVSSSPEVIEHKLGAIPRRAVPLNYGAVQGTFIMVSANSQTVTLEASTAGLVLEFYLEK